MTLDRNGFLDCNERTFDIFGCLSKEQFLSRHPAELSPPLQPDGRESIAAANEHIERAFERGSDFFEWTHSRLDGSPFAAEVLLSRFDYHGNSYLQATVRDITARKKAEAELRKLSLAVEQSPASVMIADLHGNIEYVNPKFVKVTGYTLEEVQGKNPRILKSGEATPREYQKLWEAITTGAEWRGEFHNKRKDGSLYLESASISPICDSLGAITHFIAVKEDITDRKMLENQFIQAQKMESIGRLAGGVAHDFNNMLAVIIGYSELTLKREEESSRQFKNLQEILKAAQRGAGLTRQLLAFARKQTVSPKVLNLNDTISDIVKMLQRLIGENIELALKPGTDIRPIRMDPAQIDQILVNLAVNARDAIDGVGTMTIVTDDVALDKTFCQSHVGSIPGQYVRLAVSDTGSGMEKHILEHIFEPFFTTKELGKGTGLGLSTVYGIVKQNNGFINVQSEPGKGTTFEIYLPIIEAQGGVVAGEAEVKLFYGSETLLLVEDEEAILNLSAAILQESGYTVLTARMPSEAIALAQRHETIHLLITDVIMPEINGRELEKKISLLKPGIKTLFISGYTADMISRHGVLEHGIQFLQKPFTSGSLNKKVREVLDG